MRFREVLCFTIGANTRINRGGQRPPQSWQPTRPRLPAAPDLGQLQRLDMLMIVSSSRVAGLRPLRAFCAGLTASWPRPAIQTFCAFECSSSTVASGASGARFGGLCSARLLSCAPDNSRIGTPLVDLTDSVRPVGIRRGQAPRQDREEKGDPPPGQPAAIVGLDPTGVRYKLWAALRGRYDIRPLEFCDRP
jgi:hypothetical protein